MVGGGSGGHITPLLAVAEQLKGKHPAAKISIISERMGSFNHLFDDVDKESINNIYYINAGKYRRYYGKRSFDVLFDLKRIMLNIRDAFKLFFGILESFWLLLRIRPNVVFIKGGYVGVPVGLASRLLRIPYVTHDSDAVPGLTNRLIARKARANAVGMPPEYYTYPKEKIVYVGIPITDEFLDISQEARKKKRSELELAKSDFMLLITGGSNGALRMDKIVHDAIRDLLEKYPKLNIVHQVGRENEKVYHDYPAHLHSRLRVTGFLKPIYEYISAADAVIARAGATTLTEIAAQKKPLIIIPNPYLTGGHQLKNASIYEQKKAAIVVNEHQAIKDPSLLANSAKWILTDTDGAKKMAENLYSMVRKDSAAKISDLLIDIAHKKGIKT